MSEFLNDKNKKFCFCNAFFDKNCIFLTVFLLTECKCYKKIKFFRQKNCTNDYKCDIILSCGFYLPLILHIIDGNISQLKLIY